MIASMKKTRAHRSTTRRRFLSLLLALVGLAAAPAAGASAATISFEDLSAPGPGSHGTTINAQYSAQGVTFNDPEAFDYSQGPGAIPGFAHSGTIGVETCVAAEFCSAPIRATFTAGQTTVGAWVGYSSPLPSPLTVTLTAFDAASNQVGQPATVQLPAGSSPTPITEHLVVSAPTAVIRSFEVSAQGGGATAGIAVDDIEFSTAGPPPPCTATAPPEAGLSAPRQFSFTQHDSFLLAGETHGNGAPITAASIVVTDDSGTPRTASVYPNLVRPDGGSFAPIRFNGILRPGTNDIVLTATTCAGTAESNTRRVIYTPIPPGTQIRQFGTVEVVQSVQTKLNSVPLIAASPNGIKRTFARVHLAWEGPGIDGNDSLEGVTGTLTAVRPDGSRPGGPLRVSSVGISRIEGGASHESSRDRLDAGLLFELPREWLEPGRLHLELEHVYVGTQRITQDSFLPGEQWTGPCVGCDNVGPTGTLPVQVGPSYVRFHETPPLRLMLVSMPWAFPVGAFAQTPTRAEIDAVASEIRRMYPTADVQITEATMPVRTSPPRTCSEAQDRMADFISTLGAQDSRTKYLGLLARPAGLKVRDNDGNSIGGCAKQPGKHGWVFANDPEGAAHELGHMFGRKHVKGVGEDCELFEGSSVDSAFPHVGGLIGSAAFGDAMGLDPGDASLGIGLELLRSQAGVADVMTYCDTQWISDFNYGHILGNLCDNEQAACPGHQTISGRVAGPGESGSAAPPSALARKGGGPELALRATVLPDSGRVSLDSLAVARGLAQTGPPKRSPYAIVLRGARGGVIGRYPVAPVQVADDSLRAIDAVIPFKRATAEVEIARRDEVLASTEVSEHAPTVDVLPLKGKRGAKPVKVRWRAGDADGDKLTYTLLYSADGRTYAPIAGELRKRSFRVDRTALAGGTKARFKVVANDGVLTGADGSKRFKVSFKAPRVAIQTPAAELGAGETVQLVANVSDIQDLPFAGERIVWRSSLQGDLGTGAAISPALNPGRHQITVTATNSGGVSAQASVQVSVAVAAPVFKP